MVTVQARAGGRVGLGWTYAAAAAADVVCDLLLDVVRGRDALDVPAAWSAMQKQLRNVGRPGIASCALSAVDVALWDLAARLLDVPLVRLLGRARDDVPVYGSGGFTTYDDDTLRQPAARLGRRRRHPPREDQDRRVLGHPGGPGPGPGAHRARDDRGRRRAVRRRQRRLLGRPGGADGPAIRRPRRDLVRGAGQLRRPGRPARGAVGGARPTSRRASTRWSLVEAQRLCAARAVDCLQADATRCGGYTEWLRIAAVAAAHNLRSPRTARPPCTPPWRRR